MELSFIFGTEAWEYWNEDLERHRVKSELPELPENLNSKAVESLRLRLGCSTRFTFIVCGDIHQNFNRFSTIMRHARKHRPNFLILTGDMTNNGTLHEYKRAVEYFRALEIPVINCAGNHDLENYGIRCFSRLFGPLNFFFDIGDMRFIVLNTVERTVPKDMIPLPDLEYRFSLSRGVDRQLLVYLEHLIAQKENVMLFMHIPPPVKPFDFYCFERNGREFIDLISACTDKIHGVFFGHIHGYGRSSFKGISYIEAGGAGDVDRKINKNRPGLTNRHNYVLVNVNGSHVTQTVHFIDEPKN